MGKFLVITNPSDGHVTPLIPIVRALVKSGHTVKWINGRAFKEKVEISGAEFILMHQKYDRGKTDLYDFFPKLKKLKGVLMLWYYFKHWVFDPVLFYVRQIENVLKEFKADAIIGDSFRNWALFVTERGGPPFVMVNVFPLVYPSSYLPPQGFGMLPGKSFFSKLKDSLLRLMVYKIGSWPLQNHCNQIRNQLKLPPYKNFFHKEGWDRSAMVMQPTVPQFEYALPDLPQHVYFIGPILLSVDSNFTPPEWWPKIISGEKKVILINQGTIAKNINNLIKPAIEALQDEDVYVIAVPLSDGQLSRIPANTFTSTFIPFANLLPYIDLMITNGGFGGVQNALSYGIPLILAGATEDKMEVSARVEFTKVGINLRKNNPTPKQIKSAVNKVFSKDTYRENAKRMQNEMAKFDAPRKAIELLETIILGSNKTNHG
jgi:MGT family glycosyltransferase